MSTVAAIKKKADFAITWVDKYVIKGDVRNANNYIGKLRTNIGELQALGTEEAQTLQAEYEGYIENKMLEINAAGLAAEVKAILSKAEFQFNWATKYLDQGKQSQAETSFTKLKDIIDPIADNASYAEVSSFVEFMTKFSELELRMGGGQEAAAPAPVKTTPAPVKTTPTPVKTTPAKTTPAKTTPAKTTPTPTVDYRKNDIQLNNAKGVVTRLFSGADSSIRRGETGKALQIMQSVRQGLEELKQNHQECTPGKLDAAVADIESRIKKFNDSFYGAQRRDESRPLLSDMSFGFSSFEHNIRQGKYDEALVSAERFKKGVVGLHEHELELLKDESIKEQYDSNFIHYAKMIANLEEKMEKEKRSKYGDQGDALEKILQTIKTDPRYDITEYLPQDEDEEEINTYLQHGTLEWARLAETLITENLSLKKVLLAPSDNPAFMDISKVYNQICGFIENDLIKIRAQCEILSATDFMNVKDVSEVKGVAGVHQMNIDQIESNIIRPLKEHKEDPTARKMWLPAKIFVAQWNQVTVPRMRAIGDALNAISFSKYSIGSLNSIMVECEKRIQRDSLPTTRSVNFTSSDGWTGPDFGKLTLHEEGEKYEYGDHEIADYVVRKCDKLIDSLSTDSFDSIPGAKQMEEQLNVVKLRAIKWHALNALRGLCTAGSEHRATYWQALRRYPIARSVSAYRMLTSKMKHYERQLYNLPGDVEFSENVTDPFANQTIDDAISMEQIEWYQKPLRIVPNSLQEDDNAPVCGKIHFSKNHISEGDPDFAHKCVDKFSLGEDIHARAFWPRLIKDFAVARDRSTGKLLKGPDSVEGKFNVELLLFVYLDDVAVERKGQPLKSFSWFSDSADGTSSLYSAKKSQDFVVQRNEKYEYNGSVHMDWDLIAQRISLELIRRKITSGTHQIRFEICYRIVAASLYPPEPTFFDFDTPVSQPISKGELTLNVTKKPVLHDILPKNFRKDAEVSRLQSVIKGNLDSWESFGAGEKPQPVITAAIKSDLFPMWEEEIEVVEAKTEFHGRGGSYLGDATTKTYKKINVCYRWGLSVHSASYLSPALWNHESIKFFTITAMTPNPNEKTKISPNNPAIPPVSAMTSREQIEFEADLLPENILRDAKIKRFEGDESVKSGLASVDFTHVDMFNTISDRE